MATSIFDYSGQLVSPIWSIWPIRPNVLVTPFFLDTHEWICDLALLVTTAAEFTIFRRLASTVLNFLAFRSRSSS